MHSVYDMVIRKDALVVTEKEVMPILIVDMENKTFNEAWAEFTNYLAKQNEIFSYASLKGWTKTYLAFWVFAQKRGGTVSIH